MAATVYHGLVELDERPAGCAVTIGNFDGVHRGHQRLISTARALADRSGAKVVAITFEPPPVKVLAPSKAPAALMQTSQRCEALSEAGADIVVLLQTTPALLHMTPEAFIRDVLIGRLGPAHVVEGGNFFFGRDRAGSVETLEAFGKLLGFETHVVEAVAVDLSDGSSVTVSSSLVRRLVAEGRVADAARCLGRPHTLVGPVVRGRGLGRTLDYHTANLHCGEQLLPADGVYSGWAVCEKSIWPTAISVGTRPTFGDLPRAVEAFILEPPGDLYHRRLALQFVSFIREQRKFDSPDDLRRQIAEDVKRVREDLR